MTGYTNSQNCLAKKTGGALCGCFGALDGNAIKTQCPRRKDVPDPGNCCCRKGHCALNVQATCDKMKRFLRVNPSNKGSTHDSSAFLNGRLWDLLVEKRDKLIAKGLCLVGDSAHPLAGFLQVPFELPDLVNDPTRSKDGFNHCHSSNRICIECAFDELVMRWGMFWRSLRFNLRKNALIVRTAMLLHNFIVDQRHGEPSDDFDRSHFQNFRIDNTLATQQRLTRTTGEQARAIASDDEEPCTGGRPSNQEAEFGRQGNRMRNGNVLKLATHNFRRPMQSNMRLNKQGLVHFDC